MNNDSKTYTICLKDCGCDTTDPVRLSRTLARMIIGLEYKRTFLKHFCEENNHVLTSYLKDIISH